jgi:hypothetical protein
LLDILERVEDLFFYFFEVVFHDHHPALDFRMIALATQGIDFTTHFLGNEPKFFSGRFLMERF